MVRQTAADRQRTYRKRHLEDIRKRDRERYHALKHLNPKTEERKKYEAEWRERNRPKMRAYSRKHYEAHKEEIAEHRSKRWRVTHRPKPKKTPEERRAARDRSARFYHAKRLLFFSLLKSRMHCESCGEHTAACLDFHHRDPATKLMNIGSTGRCAERSKLIAEIMKCAVLCHNCHKVHHHRERHGKPRRINAGMERRRSAILKIRALFSCSDCGESRSECIEFHHVNPRTKQFSVGNRAIHVSFPRLLKEIRKCIALCGNCHRKRHGTGDRDRLFDRLSLADIEQISRKVQDVYEEYQDVQAGLQAAFPPASR